MRFLATEKLSSHKYKTPEGYLVCVDAVLSRTGKQEYYRSELFGDSCEDADKKIAVDRLDSDVFDEKALASFENKPVCIEHPNEDVNVANHNELSVGFVRDIKRGKDNGQDVMLGTLVITDESAISAIESGEYTELSCGYDCDIHDEENPRQTNIRGNHVALCKHGRAGIARIVDAYEPDKSKSTISKEEFDKFFSDRNKPAWLTIEQWHANRDASLKSGAVRIGNRVWYIADSVNDNNVDWFIALDEHGIKFSFINGGHTMKFKSNADYALARKLANIHHMTLGYWDDQALTHSDYRSTVISNDDSKDTNVMKDNSAAYKGFMHLLQQYSMHAQQLERIVEAIRGANDLSTLEKQMLIAEANSYLASLARMADSVADIQATSAPGTDRIIYVMQSDVDENLFFYIGKTFSMKEGMWGYTKFEMGATTPDELKADLTKHGWHQVAKGPAKVIDTNDAQVADINYANETDVEFLKSAIKEMSRYISNWSFMTSRERRNISPMGLSDLKKQLSIAQKRYEALTNRNVYTDSAIEKCFTITCEKNGATHIRKVRANSIEDAIIKVKDEVSTAHKVVVFTQNILSEMGKNNSIGKYDKVISAMRQLYGQSLLPDNELKEVIRRKLPHILTKYGL